MKNGPFNEALLAKIDNMKGIWPIFENDYISVDAHIGFWHTRPTAVSLIFMQSQVLSKSALIIGLFWPSVQNAPFFMHNMLSTTGL